MFVRLFAEVRIIMDIAIRIRILNNGAKERIVELEGIMISKNKLDTKRVLFVSKVRRKPAQIPGYGKTE